jgi:hypothetical protein
LAFLRALLFDALHKHGMAYQLFNVYEDYKLLMRLLAAPILAWQTNWRRKQIKCYVTNLHAWKNAKLV